MLEFTLAVAIQIANSTILTAIVSMFVLWRYRNGVLKGMEAGGASVVPLRDLRGRQGDSFDAAAAAPTKLRWERSQRLRIAIAYAATTSTCAVPLAYAVFVDTEGPNFPSVVLQLALIYALSAAPMIAVTLALSAGQIVMALGALIALFTTLAVGGRLMEGALRGWTQSDLVSGFLSFAVGNIPLWMAALFWLLTWPRKLRGVAPITFSALLMFSLAPVVTAGSAALAGGADVMGTAGRSFLFMALPAGYVAWLRVHRLAHDYGRQRFSDAQLLSRAWWLMLVIPVWAMETTTLFITTVCAAVIVVFPVVNRLTLAPARRAARRVPAQSLLVLRVFGHTWRTERLFDRIAARWRLFGPVMMIAAPDVSARTIDAGDYLRWLTGRTKEIFVSSGSELTARLASMHLGFDPDARYRINALCCRDNAWQATVVELIHRADAVVMDVRGAAVARAGCAFELQQLARRLPLRRLVLVVDGATEAALLEAAFGPDLDQVSRVTVRRGRRTRAVFEALLDAAA